MKRFNLLPLLIGTPICVLATAIATDAITPKAAFVTQLSGNGILLEKPGFASQSAIAWQTRLRDYRENLFVPRRPRDAASYATLMGIASPSGAPKVIGPTAHIRSETIDIRYRFPCTVAGEGLLGWRPSNNRDDRGCVPPGVRIRRANSSRTGSLNPVSPYAGLPTKTKAQELSRDLLDAIKIEYCSAVGDTGVGWGVGSTVAGAGDPCRKALRDCLATSAGSDCSIASDWTWKASDRDLIVSLDCADQRTFNARGNGATIAATLLLQVVRAAKTMGANTCVFDVFAPGEVIVAPATDQLTLIQFRQRDGSVAIDALQGDVLVRSAENPQGQTISEGTSYVGGSYDGDQYFPSERPIQRLDRSSLAESPVVQSFLQTETGASSSIDLPQDMVEQIATQTQAFRQALRQTLSSAPR